jgi:CheY-like chemotaxis protein
VNRRTYSPILSRDLSVAPRARRLSSSRRAAASHQAKGRLADAAAAVLIVDGDASSAKRARDLLSRHGCEARIACSAEEAIAVLRTFHPRVVLIELVLPVMSGALLAQRLKADPETSDMVLVAVTAFSGFEAAQLAREIGCAGHVAKPIDGRTFPKQLLGYLRGTT